MTCQFQKMKSLASLVDNLIERRKRVFHGPVLTVLREDASSFGVSQVSIFTLATDLTLVCTNVGAWFGATRFAGCTATLEFLVHSALLAVRTDREQRQNNEQKEQSSGHCWFVSWTVSNLKLDWLNLVHLPAFIYRSYEITRYTNSRLSVSLSLLIFFVSRLLFFSYRYTYVNEMLLTN